MHPTDEENEALVRRFLTDVIEGGDTDASDAFVADDLVDHDLVFGDEPPTGAVIALGWQVLAAADVQITIEDVVATDERVAVRATVAGIHRESLIDLAASGDTFDIAYVWFFRIEDGVITEIWSFPDGLGLMTQLGVVSTVS
ncbi:ester cyclase [Natronomonas amylolytica]|uniref:ester cyclase n=1 Tax=Natronomonas amylolytica TaxID=3108498 RepID=UPI0030080D5C